MCYLDIVRDLLMLQMLHVHTCIHYLLVCFEVFIAVCVPTEEIQPLYLSL